MSTLSRTRPDVRVSSWRIARVDVAPASNSMMIGSVVATESGASSRRATCRQADDAVSRRYSTQPDVSSRRSRGLARLDRTPCAHLVEVAGPPDPPQAGQERRGKAWTHEPSQSQLDGFALGPQVVLAHRGGDQVVVQVDVGAGHTPTRYTYKHTTGPSASDRRP